MKTQFERVIPGMCGLNVVQARWMYTTAEPLIVLIRFYSLHGPVDWTVSRDLLWQACEEGHAGDDVHGDIVADADEANNSLIIELTTDKGHAMLAFDLLDVRNMINDTWRRVPAGTEFAMVPWDGWLRGVVGA